MGDLDLNFLRTADGSPTFNMRIRKEAAAEIDRLRAELAKFDGMLPVPAEDANDLDDVVRELGIEDSFTTPADAVRELKAGGTQLVETETDRLCAELAQVREILSDREARIAELEAAGNRLGDAAVDGVLTSIEAVTELAEAKARIAALENKNSYNLQIVREDRKRAEAELDISREAHRMVQSALLSQAAKTERAEEQAHYANGVADLAMKHRDIAEAQRDAMRDALRKIEQETIDHVAVRIARAARDQSAIKYKINMKFHRIERLYNLSRNQYLELVKIQSSACKLCNKVETDHFQLHVDHCHLTNKIRGLLCGKCNQGIGLLNHNPSLIRAAALYCEG